MKESERCRRQALRLMPSIIGTVLVGVVLPCFGSAQDGLSADVSLDALGTRNTPVPQLCVGSRFRTELERTISAAWDNVPLRVVLKRISEDRAIAILLDRRIDPDQTLDLQVNGTTVLQTVRNVAQRAGAEVSVAHNVLYVGPPSSARILRTLIELRTRELFDRQNELPRGRVLDLSRRRTFSWSDLDRPRDLAHEIAQRCGLSIEHAERIPHDLWAAAALPEANAIEVFSLILIQFDLSFAWRQGATEVSLEKVPESVALEKPIPTHGTDVRTALTRVNDTFPGLLSRIEGNRIVVRGTVEECEQAEELLRGKKSPTIAGEKADRPAPLHRRLFTLRVEHVPVIDLMKKLESTDVIFRFNPDALAAARVDLNQRISMNVHQVEAQEFFRQMFEPLHLAYTIDDLTVSLTPK